LGRGARNLQRHIWRCKGLSFSCPFFLHERLNETLQIIQLSPSRRPITLLSLDPSPSVDPGSISEDVTAPYAITSVSWAPSCGRSYHLVATGGRDGHVRVWKLHPNSLDDGRTDGPEEAKWTGSVVADFDHHK
jgi:nucleoporin SEH1